MRRSVAFGTLVGFSLTALVALGQGAAPSAAPPKAPAPAAKAPAASASAPAAPPPGAAPAAAGAAAAAAPAPTAPPSAAPAPSASAPAAPPPSAAPPAETAPPPASAAPPASASAPPPASSAAAPAAAAAATTTDRGEEPKKHAPDPWQDAHAIALEGDLFVGGRLGPSSIEPSEESRVGLGFDVSAWLTLSEEYVLGLGVTRADLGTIDAGSGTDTFEGEYALTAAYLGARAFPYRRQNFEVFIGLRVGLAWQDFDASGLRNPDPNVSAPVVYACSGSAGPGLALGAGIGSAVRLGKRTWLNGHLDANGYKLSSDVIDDCAVGIGSVTNVTLGAGLLYAFDIGDDNKLDARAY